MARAWKVEEEVTGMTGSMEAMLIEVFGCEPRNGRYVASEFPKGSAAAGGYRPVNGSAMEAMLIEVFGCAPLDDVEAQGAALRRNRRSRVDFARYVNGMEDSLVEIFGCVRTGRVFAGNTLRDKKRMKAEFARYIDGMEDSLLEIYGCASLNHRIVQLDAMRERRRLKAEPTLDRFPVEVQAMRVPRVMKR